MIYFSIISSVVSVASLILGIINALNSKDKIEMAWHKEVIKGETADFTFSINNGFPRPIMEKMSRSDEVKSDDEVTVTLMPKNPVLMQLTVINYGNKDIGFWNLNVTDENGKRIQIETADFLNLQGTKYMLQRVGSSKWVPIEIPNDTNGVFKAHSFTEWNILVDLPDPEVQELTAEIALTKKKFFKLRKKLTYIGAKAIYDLNSHIVVKNKDIYNYGNDTDDQGKD